MGPALGLHELVFERMHIGIRQRVLSHIKENADTTPRHCIVLCDIDDTFWASWKDHRYPTQTVYPGCLQVRRMENWCWYSSG